MNEKDSDVKMRRKWTEQCDGPYGTNGTAQNNVRDERTLCATLCRSHVVIEALSISARDLARPLPIESTETALKEQYMQLLLRRMLVARKISKIEY